MIEAFTIGGRLLARAARDPDATAVVDASETVTYEQLAARAAAASSALIASGVTRGDRFAVLCRNSTTLLELMHAASMSSTVMVPLNFRLAPREIEEILDDSGARLLFVEDEWRALVDDVPESVATVRVADHGATPDYLRWRNAGPASSDAVGVDSPDPDSSSVVLQMYTTGTTGRPKGVMITEANIAAMLPAVVDVFTLDAGSRYLALLPMFHISGGGTPLAVLAAGGTVVLASGTSADSVLADLERQRITHANLVPSLISMLVADSGTAGAELTALRVVMYGAAPSGATVITEAMELLPHCSFLHGYGLTECTGAVTFAAPHRRGDRTHDLPGSVGSPVPGCELRIVDPESMTDAPGGEPGEVWVRSAQNTIGYWNRPMETAALFADGGWLRTGDIGAISDGQLLLKDRLKDMIISGGENVYSAEVENVVSSHPAVLEVAVIGVPDERWGEAVKAVVTLRPGASVRPEEIIEFTRARLAHYKCPKHVEITAELPKSGSGKILKRMLRDDAR